MSATMCTSMSAVMSAIMSATAMLSRRFLRGLRDADRIEIRKYHGRMDGGLTDTCMSKNSPLIIRQPFLLRTIAAEGRPGRDGQEADSHAQKHFDFHANFISFPPSCSLESCRGVSPSAACEAAPLKPPPTVQPTSPNQRPLTALMPCRLLMASGWHFYQIGTPAHST